MTETINILLICKFKTTTTEIIQNLLAFGVIAEIDDFYAKSLKNSFSQQLLNNSKLKFSKLGKDDTDSLEINKSLASKALMGIYKSM
jgi:hypothetical protein